MNNERDEEEVAYIFPEVLTEGEEEVVILYRAIYTSAIHAVTGKNGGELVQFIEQACACCLGNKWLARKGLEGRGISGDDSFQFVEAVSQQTFSKFLTFLCKQHSPVMIHLLYRDAIETEADRAAFPFPKEFVNRNQDEDRKKKKRY